MGQYQTVRPGTGFFALADGWRMVIDPRSETMGYVHAFSVTKDMASLTFCLSSLAKWIKLAQISMSIHTDSTVQCECDEAMHPNTRLAFRLLDKHAELQHGKLLTSVTLCAMTIPTCAQHTWLFWVLVPMRHVPRLRFLLHALDIKYHTTEHAFLQRQMDEVCVFLQNANAATPNLTDSSKKKWLWLVETHHMTSWHLVYTSAHDSITRCSNCSQNCKTKNHRRYVGLLWRPNHGKCTAKLRISLEPNVLRSRSRYGIGMSCHHVEVNSIGNGILESETEMLKCYEILHIKTVASWLFGRSGVHNLSRAVGLVESTSTALGLQRILQPQGQEICTLLGKWGKQIQNDPKGTGSQILPPKMMKDDDKGQSWSTTLRCLQEPLWTLVLTSTSSTTKDRLI